MLKRIFDIAISGAALILLAPLLVLIAMAVTIGSGRPILFHQERVGRDFRVFRLWKFRSMAPQRDGSLVTVAGDHRITKVGAILRATKLDELPQLWNVLKGDMSLVGPRPEVPYYVELCRPQYERILRVRPGITDLASLAYRHEEKVLSASPDPERFYREVILPAKLKLAEEYIERQSIWLDLSIIARTAVAAARLA